MKIRFLLFSIILAVTSAPAPLNACLVCVADPLETVLVAELERSAQVVLARPVGDSDEGRFRIETIYRGTDGLAVGTEVKASLPLFSSEQAKIGQGAVLLTRRGHKAEWVIRAPASPSHVAFFEEVLTLPKAGSGDLLDELGRAIFFARHLHHEDAVLARAGAAELTRLPYPMLRRIRSRLDPEKIRKELGNPASADRYALFHTLLGLCGTDEDRAEIRRRLETMWQGKNWRSLGALLTAKLELEGESVVDEIEERYFRDRERTLPEIEQAILALRVHGDADDGVGRQRIIVAFRNFLSHREPLASLVIADLTRWQDWESKQVLVGLAERRGDDFPEIRRQVDAYLLLCPN